jgi:hypothetical protein
MRPGSPSGLKLLIRFGALIAALEALRHPKTASFPGLDMLLGPTLECEQ